MSDQEWNVEYCFSGTEPTAKISVLSLESAKLWAHAKAGELGIEFNVFDSKFVVDKPDFKQWGTGYHWLCITPVQVDSS